MNEFVVLDQPADYEPRCFKLFTQQDSPNNKIYEHIAFKQNVLIRKFTRELQLSNGVVVNKTNFALVN